MYKSSDDLILSETGNIRSIPGTLGRKYHTQSVTNHWAEFREAAEKVSSQKIQRQPIVWKYHDELEFSWILMLKNIHID